MTANAEAEFARVDANKDGQMSRTEIENYQRTSATARITARNKALFAELDADKNGQISAVEFAKASPIPQSRRDRSSCASMPIRTARSASPSIAAPRSRRSARSTPTRTAR